MKATIKFKVETKNTEDDEDLDHVYQNMQEELDLAAASIADEVSNYDEVTAVEWSTNLT